MTEISQEQPKEYWLIKQVKRYEKWIGKIFQTRSSYHWFMMGFVSGWSDLFLSFAWDSSSFPFFFRNIFFLLTAFSLFCFTASFCQQERVEELTFKNKKGRAISVKEFLISFNVVFLFFLFIVLLETFLSLVGIVVMFVMSVIR